MSNFELVQKYGASVFVIHKFLEEQPNSTVVDIQIETGLSDNCVKAGLEKLLSDNLLKRVHGFIKKSKGYRYTTIQ
jgi:predicted transcriptional regulator